MNESFHLSIGVKSIDEQIDFFEKLLGGTSVERKKMYLKCPTGYLVELKGYR